MRNEEIQAMQNNYSEVLQQVFENAEEYKNRVLILIDRIKSEDQKQDIEKYNIYFDVLEEYIEQLLTMCETFDTEYTRVYDLCKEVTEALEEKDSTLYNQVFDREDSLILDYVEQEEEYHDDEEEE